MGRGYGKEGKRKREEGTDREKGRQEETIENDKLMGKAQIQ